MANSDARQASQSIGSGDVDSGSTPEAGVRLVRCCRMTLYRETDEHMATIPLFEPQQLERICKILADTSEGLTGSELGYLLRQSQIPDVAPEMTKWKRLFNGLVTMQNERRFGNHVLVFITEAR